jgi:hypothetical protein
VFLADVQMAKRGDRVNVCWQTKDPGADQADGG